MLLALLVLVAVALLLILGEKQSHDAPADVGGQAQRKYDTPAPKEAATPKPSAKPVPRRNWKRPKAKPKAEDDPYDDL